MKAWCAETLLRYKSILTACSRYITSRTLTSRCNRSRSVCIRVTTIRLFSLRRHLRISIPFV